MQLKVINKTSRIYDNYAAIFVDCGNCLHSAALRTVQQCAIGIRQ